jgi:hypothetical protein
MGPPQTNVLKDVIHKMREMRVVLWEIVSALHTADDELRITSTISRVAGLTSGTAGLETTAASSCEISCLEIVRVRKRSHSKRNGIVTYQVGKSLGSPVCA